MAYVVEKAGRHYAVIYEGTNPITGRERRRWRRCPTQANAEALARQLGTQRARLRQAGSLLSSGDYLLRQSLPAREAALTATTYARHIASIEHYLVPHLGRVQLRQLRSDQLTALYRGLATNGGHKGRPLAELATGHVDVVWRGSWIGWWRRSMAITLRRSCVQVGQ